MKAIQSFWKNCRTISQVSIAAGVEEKNGIAVCPINGIPEYMLDKQELGSSDHTNFRNMLQVKSVGIKNYDTKEGNICGMM